MTLLGARIIKEKRCSNVSEKEGKSEGHCWIGDEGGCLSCSGRKKGKESVKGNDWTGNN